MLTDPVSVSGRGLATLITRGLLVKLLLVSWPAFGLAGLGAIFHAADVGAYVTQATTTNVPPDGPVGIKQLKRFVTQASGVTFVLDDIWDGRDDKVFGIFSEDGGGVVASRAGDCRAGYRPRRSWGADRGAVEFVAA